MRTIKKISLDILAKTMPVISEIEQRNFVGGDVRCTYAEAITMIRNGTWQGGFITDRNYYMGILCGSGMYNSFYIGPTSDMVLNEFFPKPKHAADYIAQQHDLEYQKLELNGISGTLHIRSKEADQRLVDRCQALINCNDANQTSYNGYAITKDSVTAARRMISYFISFGHLDFLR